jgi:hypothetical protein
MWLKRRETWNWILFPTKSYPCITRAACERGARSYTSPALRVSRVVFRISSVIKCSRLGTVQSVHSSFVANTPTDIEECAMLKMTSPRISN